MSAPDISSLKALSFYRFQATWLLWNLRSLMNSWEVVILKLDWLFVVLWQTKILFIFSAQLSSLSPSRIYALLLHPSSACFMGRDHVYYWCTLSGWHDVHSVFMEGTGLCSWQSGDQWRSWSYWQRECAPGWAKTIAESYLKLLCLRLLYLYPFILTLPHPSLTLFSKVEVKVLVAQLYLTVCNPMDCSQPGCSVHGILQARILEWVAIPFSRGIFPNQGLNPSLLYCRQILYCLT